MLLLGLSSIPRCAVKGCDNECAYDIDHFRFNKHCAAHKIINGRDCKSNLICYLCKKLITNLHRHARECSFDSLKMLLNQHKLRELPKCAYFNCSNSVTYDAWQLRLHKTCMQHHGATHISSTNRQLKCKYIIGKSLIRGSDGKMQSKCELNTHKYIQNIFPKLKLVHSAKFGKYTVDIYIPSLHLAIECDGIWHHKNFIKEIQRDIYLYYNFGVKVRRLDTRYLNDIVCDNDLIDLIMIESKLQMPYFFRYQLKTCLIGNVMLDTYLTQLHFQVHKALWRASKPLSLYTLYFEVLCEITMCSFQRRK